jgi:hypothetical protein
MLRNEASSLDDKPLGQLQLYKILHYVQDDNYSEV